MSGVDFSVRLQPEGDRMVVVVAGELDDATGGQLRDAVSQVTLPGVVLFDLAGVSFMDSRGLGQLLSVCMTVEDSGGKAYVADPSVHAERVLRTAGLSDRLREPD
jgi:stage II sporulation protein AA (anti-sigma F factor antagonist)